MLLRSLNATSPKGLATLCASWGSSSCAVNKNLSIKPKVERFLFTAHDDDRNITVL
ncbi:unnamed protein product [Psylliodes chrysocephalus]|uniref:Uncharacterized protein n=1 Tax=Psylliodes chrysocephalus TaxID=3402493 RepID=A0A9P0CQG0_9CUCU|nr:unnamed protein product [Psylliodes chrysocephala]